MRCSDCGGNYRSNPLTRREKGILYDFTKPLELIMGRDEIDEWINRRVEDFSRFDRINYVVRLEAKEHLFKLLLDSLQQPYDANLQKSLLKRLSKPPYLAWNDNMGEVVSMVIDSAWEALENEVRDLGLLETFRPELDAFWKEFFDPAIDAVPGNAGDRWVKAAPIMRLSRAKGEAFYMGVWRAIDGLSILIEDLLGDNRKITARKIYDAIWPKWLSSIPDTYNTPSGVVAALKNQLHLGEVRGIAEIDAYVFDVNKDWEDLSRYSYAFNEQYLDAHYWSLYEQGELEGKDIPEKIFLRIGEYYWVFIDKSYCLREAKRMRHCGNEGGSKNARILSLRSKDGKPHLTFIIHLPSYEGSKSLMEGLGPDSAPYSGWLGEMKGRGNSRPIPKYHPYIIELLKHPIVRSVRGGGYLPENNFSINDLSDDQITELRELKPELFAGL